MTGSLARVIAAYREQWPDVHLHLSEMPALEQVRALQGGQIDLGLMLPPVEGAAIISDPVWSEEWLAAFPESHPLAHRTKLHATLLTVRTSSSGISIVVHAAAGVSSIC
jgi:DNA-binding transcriptional LysR family regulator